jgi:hypothetical protein
LSSHLRHRPKHRKPLPCVHCALTAKPAQATVVVMGLPIAPSDASTSVEIAQATVDRLMETVDAAKTNKQVKHALHILSSPKSASAIRGARWREKQKQQNPDFDKKEAERKAVERAEVDRVQQIENTLRSNPVPLFVMKDAPEGEGLLVTGEVDTAQLEKIEAAVIRKATGRAKPKGHEPDAKDTLKEFEDSFAPIFMNSKEVRLLHQFVYENTKKSSIKNPMRVCVLCNEQIGTGADPGASVEGGYHHLQNRHPEQFTNFLARLKNKGCTEDHEGMVRRHGGSIHKVQCGRCRKILWKPPKKAPEPRSDRTAKAAA